MYLRLIKIARIQHLLDHCEIQVLMQGTMIVRNKIKKENYPKCDQGFLLSLRFKNFGLSRIP